MKAKHTK